jgi:pimeloyl-ACP methyl ester carboxylesterase
MNREPQSLNVRIGAQRSFSPVEVVAHWIEQQTTHPLVPALFTAFQLGGLAMMTAICCSTVSALLNWFQEAYVNRAAHDRGLLSIFDNAEIRRRFSSTWLSPSTEIVMNKFLLSASIAIALTVTATAAASPGPTATIKNVVLVHGAFADGSGWVTVANILRRDGFNVAVAQPPETSLEDDVAATTRAIDGMGGPVVLVGHSYGGVIITTAGNDEHVKSLVYVAAFQPDTGESLGSLAASKPPASSSLVPSPDGFLYIGQSTFHADFCADLPAAQAQFMAQSQVGLAIKAAGTATTTPAWKAKPSFAIVAKNDHAINPDLERFMYQRAGSKVTELASSHAVYISRPAEVAAVIERAAQ